MSHPERPYDDIEDSSAASELTEGFRSAWPALIIKRRGNEISIILPPDEEDAATMPGISS